MPELIRFASATIIVCRLAFLDVDCGTGGLMRPFLAFKRALQMRATTLPLGTAKARKNEIIPLEFMTTLGSQLNRDDSGP